tara:strand:+ start:176 stop:373 length:198 start_codon:yes stop_codon:yes gene_type:complete
MSKINSYLIDREAKGELEYDEERRRYVEVGQRCTTSRGSQGAGGEVAERTERYDAENAGRAELSH